MAWTYGKEIPIYGYDNRIIGHYKKIYDENGKEIGTLQPFLPPQGIIFPIRFMTDTKEESKRKDKWKKLTTTTEKYGIL